MSDNNTYVNLSLLTPFLMSNRFVRQPFLAQLPSPPKNHFHPELDSVYYGRVYNL